jgi:hypothetical protein
MSDKISMICEQGDLGLWANELSEKDQKAYRESTNNSNKSQSSNEKKEK